MGSGPQFARCLCAWASRCICIIGHVRHFHDLPKAGDHVICFVLFYFCFCFPPGCHSGQRRQRRYHTPPRQCLLARCVPNRRDVFPVSRRSPTYEKIPLAYSISLTLLQSCVALHHITLRKTLRPRSTGIPCLIPHSMTPTL
jgi:hypothetical protein